MKNIIFIPIVVWFILVIATNLYTCATRKVVGAQCCDETMSKATGSGACSSHGGVMCWEYEYWYTHSKNKNLYKNLFMLPDRFRDCKSCDE